MEPLVGALLKPAAYDHPVSSVELLETHISWVILTGEFAYKLKKPVNFGFVDFSTLEKRRFCCVEELRLNSRLAADLYLAVKPVFGPPDHASFHGRGEPIEFAVQMRQFPQSSLLPAALERGELSADVIEQLAKDVADFQRAAGVAGAESSFGTPDAVSDPIDTNFRALQSASQAGDETIAGRLRQLRDWCDGEFHRLHDEFACRKRAGKIREGHGDMHLGNMVLRSRGAEPPRIEVFDCLEFNPGLRWIDVVSEIAFLVMDLDDRRRSDLGWRFLNAWLEQTGDFAGLKVWRWYYCYRAMVRAKVAALRRNQPEITAEAATRLDQQFAEYLELARGSTEPRSPRLIITHGVSGSGKSYQSQQIAAQQGWIRIRSDVERKRLIDGKGELYSPSATAATYRHLLQLAKTVLECGFSVLIDATFLKREQRQSFRTLANAMNVPGELLEFTAPEPVLRQRVLERQNRGDDPSDATIDVLEQQLAMREPIKPDEGWSCQSIG